MDFDHEEGRPLTGVYDATTAWRMSPIGQGLALFGFEDIAGRLVEIPEGLQMTIAGGRNTYWDRRSGSVAPLIGRQWVLQEGCSYDLMGTGLRTLLTINARRCQRVEGTDEGNVEPTRFGAAPSRYAGDNL